MHRTKSKNNKTDKWYFLLAVQHLPMQHDQGFTGSHWTPPSGDYWRCIAPVAARAKANKTKMKMCPLCWPFRHTVNLFFICSRSASRTSMCIPKNGQWEKLVNATGKWVPEKGQLTHVFAMTGEFLSGQLNLPMWSAWSSCEENLRELSI